ncbi:hypothetical protein ACFPKF_003049, partial [Salmonella enterica]|uniref:hypothetical protein n=1 Tax=Salmonella enterica TaxID=28901 RepID=UPI00265B9889
INNCIFNSFKLLSFNILIDVIDQLVLLISKRLGIKTGHVKLCIVLQGFACFFRERYLKGWKCWGEGER